MYDNKDVDLMVQSGIIEFSITNIIFLIANIILYICIIYLLYKYIQRRKKGK